jgi:hypothetical protein
MAPVAAAVLPHPPLLVPELAGAAASELAPLRAACHEALSTVVAAADLTILIGDGPVWAVPAPSAPGSFRPYGADVDVALPTLVDLDLPALPPPAQLSDLPLSLAVAAHLLEDLDPPPARLFAATVPRSLGPLAAATIGRTLSTTARFGLVVMADLSARRTERAPGALHPDAADFDARVADAFRTGTPRRLLALDPTQSADLLVTGRAPLQVLAGAFDQGPPGGDAPAEGGPASGGARPHEVDAAAGDAGTDEGGTATDGVRLRAVGAAAGDAGTDETGLASGGVRLRVVGPAARDAGTDEGELARGGVEQGAVDPATADAVLDQTGSGVRGRVLYEGAPYGVGYLVALLTT